MKKTPAESYARQNVLPHYITGAKGKHWALSLRAAQNRGATIVVEETDEVVWYRPGDDTPSRRRPWRDRRGNRYDHRDCVPVF
jgi:hypothetical protein